MHNFSEADTVPIFFVFTAQFIFVFVVVNFFQHNLLLKLRTHKKNTKVYQE